MLTTKMLDYPVGAKIAWNAFITSSAIDIEDCGVTFVSCTFELSNYTDDLYEFAGVKRFSGFERAVVKRKAEYLAGRYVAQRALFKRSGIMCDIPIGPSRAPVWPQGHQGSISHTENSVICAIQAQNADTYLGVDIEELLSRKLRAEVEKLIAFDNEIARLQTVFDDIETLVTFIFSAKESLFKALFPHVSVYFDFLDAEIMSVNSSEFEIRLVKTISSGFNKGMTFKGGFLQSNGKILTIISDKQLSLTTLKAII